MKPSRLRQKQGMTAVLWVAVAALALSGCLDNAQEAATMPPNTSTTVAAPPTGAFGMPLKTQEEIEALEAKALAGEQAAMTLAIDTHILGIGVQMNEGKAYRLAKEGARMGMLDAKAALGRALTLEGQSEIPTDPAAGRKLLEEAFSAGSERAARALANELPEGERVKMLIAFHEEHGIKDPRTAMGLAESCMRTASSKETPRAGVEANLSCAREWIERAAPSPIMPAEVSGMRLYIATTEMERLGKEIGNLGALVEAFSETVPGSHHDARFVSAALLVRARMALDGKEMPRNARAAREFALRATEISSVEPLHENRDLSRQIYSFLRLLHLPVAGEFPDPKRSYGWALLEKATTEDWTGIGERVLSRQGNVLSQQERRLVEDAIASWVPGQDLSFPEDPKAEGEGQAGVVHGTAFLITEDGFAITNAHVAKECKTIKDTAGGVAAFIAMDEANDLAAIRFGSYNDKPHATLEAASRLPRVGDRIAVFGFPLSEVLASTGNLTAGELTANAGLGNNSSMFQISAPIQPGSSGSPVLSMRGNVAGIVSSTASTVRLSQATGAIGQNLNFAINKDTVMGFLRSNGIPFEEAGDGYFSGGELDVAEIGARAREWTLQIECQR